jgi:hypothetical protein
MRDKLDGGIMILSASSSGSTLAVFSAERIDKGNLDIQPFGLFVRSSGADATMALVHHGGWLDRTTPLPGDFWSIASTCSTGSYFFAKPPEGKVSGSLDELTAPHRDAYGRIVDYYSSESSAT